MFSLLFSTGRECSFSLGSYKREEGIFACQAYIPQIDDTFHGSANPPSIAVHGINVRYPTAGEVNVPHICHLVRRVLAFHRWADTPAALRPALEEHDRRTAVVARAAALQASRHLLMTRVAKGNLSAQEALSRSSMFVSRMQSLTNPSSPTLGSHQIRANNVAVSPTSHSREASTISSTSPTPFSCITPSPVGRRVAVVSEGSTIATGTSERSSSLTYSQISSIPTVSSSSASFEAAATSSNRHANAATPGRRVAIVSPESAYSEEDNVTLAADQVAGCYLYKNISIHPTLNSFGKLEPHIVSPDSKFEEVMSSNKKTCAKVHLVEIPHSRKLFPDYQPALNATTTKYLSSTYVQSAVDDSMRQASKNAEYLKQFSMPAVE